MSAVDHGQRKKGTSRCKKVRRKPEGFDPWDVKPQDVSVERKNW